MDRDWGTLKHPKRYSSWELNENIKRSRFLTSEYVKNLFWTKSIILGKSNGSVLSAQNQMTPDYSFLLLPFNTWSLPVKRWQPFLEGSFWLSFSLYSQLLTAAEQNHQGLIGQPLLQLPLVLWFQNGKTDNVTGSMLQSVLSSKLQIQITKQNILSLLNVITHLKRINSS